MNTENNVLYMILNKPVKMSSGNIKRILMYKCTYTDDTLKEITKFLVDGTFKCCPAPFSQLFIILGIYKIMSLPLFNCFMPGKSTPLYIEIFKVLRDCIGKKKVFIALDLELGVIRAFQQLFGVNLNL